MWLFLGVAREVEDTSEMVAHTHEILEWQQLSWCLWQVPDGAWFISSFPTTQVQADPLPRGAKAHRPLGGVKTKVPGGKGAPERDDLWEPVWLSLRSCWSWNENGQEVGGGEGGRMLSRSVAQGCSYPSTEFQEILSSSLHPIPTGLGSCGGCSLGAFPSL